MTDHQIPAGPPANAASATNGTAPDHNTPTNDSGQQGSVWQPEGADLLRALGLYGRHIDTSRPRTPLEQATYGGPGVEGGSGLLVGWAVRDLTVTHNGASESHAQIPHIAVDYGYEWAILPGTVITIRDATPGETASLIEAGLA